MIKYDLNDIVFIYAHMFRRQDPNTITAKLMGKAGGNYVRVRRGKFEWYVPTSQLISTYNTVFMGVVDKDVEEWYTHG